MLEKEKQPELSYYELINTKTYDNNPIERKVFDLLNFLEEISLALNNHLLGEKLTKDYFGYIIPRYWDVFREWIEDRRVKSAYLVLYLEIESVSRK